MQRCCFFCVCVFVFSFTTLASKGHVNRAVGEHMGMVCENRILVSSLL